MAGLPPLVEKEEEDEEEDDTSEEESEEAEEKEIPVTKKGKRGTPKKRKMKPKVKTPSKKSKIFNF